MENEIIKNAKEMARVLMNDCDIILKKTKDNELKIMYYRPKKLKG